MVGAGFLKGAPWIWLKSCLSSLGEEKGFQNHDAQEALFPDQIIVLP